MKKIILTIVCFLCFNVESIANDFVNNIVNSAKKTKQNAVSIVTIDPGLGYCSGVVLKNNNQGAIILTAKHCIGMDEEIYVNNVLVVHFGLAVSDDLAYLITNEKIPNKEPVKLAKEEAKKGDIIYIFGYPNTKPYIKFGEVTLRTKKWQFANIDVIGGCSGGGIYNKNGELVGIVWGSVISSKKGIFEPLDDIKKFLVQSKLNESYSILVK